MILYSGCDIIEDPQIACDDCIECYRFDICKKAYINKISDKIMYMILNHNPVMEMLTDVKVTGTLAKIFKAINDEISKGIPNDIIIDILDESIYKLSNKDTNDPEFNKSIIRFLNFKMDNILPREVERLSISEYNDKYNSSYFDNGAILLFTNKPIYDSFKDDIRYHYIDINIVNIIIPKEDWKFPNSSPFLIILGKDKEIIKIHYDISIQEAVKIILSYKIYIRNNYYLNSLSNLTQNIKKGGI